MQPLNLIDECLSLVDECLNRVIEFLSLTDGLTLPETVSQGV